MDRRTPGPRREGGSVTEGRDGDTYCLHITSGTAVDILADDDVDERDWRRASRLLRFASAADRETYIGVRWGELDPPTNEPPRSPASPTTVHFVLYAGQTNTRIDLSLHREESGARMGYRAESIDFPRVELNTTAGRDEVERFLAELRLLGAPSWRQFGARAVDGLLWTLTAAGDISIDAGGANAYPPHGEGSGRTATFDRLLLAAERLLGRGLWSPAQASVLEAIPDHRDRIEHLILAACRSWAAEGEREGIDPGTLKEREFQKALLPQLVELTPTEREAPPGLADWDPGNADFVLEPEELSTWVELKWCKRRHLRELPLGCGQARGRGETGPCATRLPARGGAGGRLGGEATARGARHRSKRSPGCRLGRGLPVMVGMVVRGEPNVIPEAAASPRDDRASGQGAPLRLSGLGLGATPDPRRVARR